jgi:hypothetical protein
MSKQNAAQQSYCAALRTGLNSARPTPRWMRSSRVPRLKCVHLHLSLPLMALSNTEHKQNGLRGIEYLTGWRSRNASTCISFSSGSTEHVLYTSSPPGFTKLTAASSSSACSFTNSSRLSWLFRHRKSALCAGNRSGKGSSNVMWKRLYLDELQVVLALPPPQVGPLRGERVGIRQGVQ